MICLSMQIQCPSCNAAYQVSGRPAGTAVSCQCGETFGFPAANTSTARQCPGCGAPAAPADCRCQYCDISLRNVCCPNCFQMIFGGEKHCAHCGTDVTAPAVYWHRHGAASLPCPRCDSPLTANLVEDQLFDRCDHCGGIWAHHLAIQNLSRSQTSKWDVRRWLATLPGPDQSKTAQKAAAPCPDCEMTMSRHEVPAHRRVLIDACAMHGVWFDHQEIRSLVGMDKTTRKRNRSGYKQPKLRASAHFNSDADDWWPWEALEELLDFFEDIFD